MELSQMAFDSRKLAPKTTPCTRSAVSSASGTSPMRPPSPRWRLHALQHRGQEATGIVSFDGARFHSHRGMGLVGDNFSDAAGDRQAAGPDRPRPQPLRHHRRHHPAQRPAALCGFRVRRPSPSRITAT